jgi:hypothetical protein
MVVLAVEAEALLEQLLVALVLTMVNLAVVVASTLVQTFQVEMVGLTLVVVVAVAVITT